VKARPDDTVMIAARGCARSCSDRAEHVGRHHGLGRGQEGLRLVPVLDPHNAGHGDEHVEVGVPGQYLLGRGIDAGRIGRVELHGAEAGVLGGDPLEQLSAPAADDHGVAPGLQRDGEREPDTAGRAGDEDGVPGNVHALDSGRPAPDGAESACRGISDPWLAHGGCRILGGWTA
jgi:hypothetical protein